MKKVISIVDFIGCHTYICPKCKREGFLGFFMKKSPMKWRCIGCSEPVLIERNNKRIIEAKEYNRKLQNNK